MKIHKKIIGFLSVTLVALGLLFVLQSHVLAFTKGQIEDATFEFVDRSTIKATVGGTSLDFVSAFPLRGGSGGGLFGGANITGLYNADASANDSCTAAIALPDDFKLENLGKFPQTISKDNIVWHYKDPQDLKGCDQTANVKKPISGADEGARTYFKWVDDSTIVSVDGQDTFKKTAAGDFRKESEAGDSCRDRIFVSGNRGIYFELDKKDGFSTDGFNHEADLGDDCKVWGVNYVKHNSNATGGDNKDLLKRLAGIGASIGDASKANIPGELDESGDDISPGATGDDEACYSSNWALSWLACPVITTAQSLANRMYGFVESQLRFTVSDDGTRDSLGSSHQEVKSAWNNFRVLASGLVVILLLVMVIGQAIGTGPFDAYTVRKLLPRLVMGVILIQLSWPIFSWVVNSVDDLGRGLADIIYAPFGGASKLNLKEVMVPYADSSNQTAFLFSWFTFLGAAVTAVVAPFLVLGLILTILVAIFAGFLALLFRKILIILALIFVPVALIAWMMPNDGLRRYWKLWWDNFIKALMMFPLIILIIAGGRIFAKIGSGQKDLVGFFIVLVGFFGPLFILPKTFKWGGTAMMAAGNLVSKAQTAGLKKPKEVLKGFNERYQGERAKAYSTLDSRGMRAFRRIQSGHFLPTERSRRLTIAAGNKWASERNEEADAMALRTQEKALAGYDYADMNDDGNFLRYSKNAAGGYLDRAGNVVDKTHAHSVQVADRKDASFERLTGVPAGKQALVDLAGHDGKSDAAKRIAQAADKLLVDTHSEIELQNSRVQYGANSGRRVNETAVWKDTITNSPSHYSAINNSRPDFAPDLEENAEQAASRRLGRTVTYQTANATDRREIDADKAVIAIERLTPEQAAQVHYGFYDDIGDVGAQAAIDRKTGAPILDAAGNPINISQYLAQRLIDFKNSPGTVGANAVGSLHGGKQEHVDSALAASGHTLNTLP